MSFIATEGTDFPIENIPFGIFTRPGVDAVPRAGTAIGHFVVDLHALAEHKYFAGPLLANTNVFSKVFYC